jgi:murein tripeptide amidase MpaA
MSFMPRSIYSSLQSLPSTICSYFPPFSYERHLDLVSRCAEYASVESLGQTLDGREIDCVMVGEGNLTCWIIHRQHPGETMAEHYAEGLLTRLLGLDSQGEVDDEVKKLLSMYKFCIVPCMCLDGVVRGHLRTNGCGANLNREWATKRFYKAPTLERSPEVYHVLNKMDETVSCVYTVAGAEHRSQSRVLTSFLVLQGVDCFLDIHGDEELPFNFLAGATLVPNWDKRMESLHGAFAAAYTRANPDMQKKYGYPPAESPELVLEYMNVATNQVANRFNCLGLTLEMPFKDCLTNSDPEYGWTPKRSRELGASVLGPLEYIHQYLRAEGEFWTQLPDDDAYVKTTNDIHDEVNAKSDFVRLTKRFYSDVHEIRKPVRES